MENYPENFNQLIEAFKSFPGVGKRSAERMAFTVIKWTPERVANFAKIISDLNEKCALCAQCGNISERDQLCRICSDSHRDPTTICVVEDIPQIYSIEKCKTFKGLYHVLHGKIVPLDGVNVDNVHLERLKKRIERGKVSEVIMALSMDVEGQATTIYISNILKQYNVKVSRIARGIPIGSDISFADPATLSAALSGRSTI